MATADVDGDGRVTDDDAYIISSIDLGVTREEALRVVHGGYGVGCPSGFQSGLCSKRQFTIRDGNLAVGNVGVAAARLAIDTLGSAGDGIAVSVNSANSAIYAEQQGAGYAGYFSGKLHITDVLTLKEPRGGGPTIKLDPIRTNQNNTFQILRSDGSEAIGFDSAFGTIRAGRLDLTTNIGSGNIVADSITANTTINSPQFCIGLDCKTAWTGIQPDTNLFLATGQHQYSWLGAATSVASIQSRINAGAGAGVSSAVLWWNPATNSWSNDTVPIGAAITFAISGGSKQVALPVSLNDNFGLTTGVLAANTGYFAGNVGIGTLAPGYKLSVVDTGLIPIINIWNNSVTNAWTGTRLARGGTGDETEKWFLGMNDSDDSLRFRSKGSTDDVIIDTDGNVAIAKKLKLGNAELYWDDRGTPATTDDRLVIKVNP